MRRRPAAPPAPRVRWPRLAAVVLGVLALYALALYLGQDGLIWIARRYDTALVESPPAGLRPLRYAVDGVGHVAFWRPPAAEERPRWWVAFGGNAALALDWQDVLEADPDPGAGWLLIDHPGYGANGGEPDPVAADRAADAALAALTGERGAALGGLRVLGHSLGAAVALRFATRHAVDRVVALAPFTDLVSMARRRFGWPFCHLLRHRFDNRACPRELAARRPRPWVSIVHGADDALIPAAMGRALAEEFPWASYAELPGVGHNDLLQHHDALRTAMGGG